MWNLEMIQMNLFTKQIDSDRKQTYGYQRGKVKRGINQEFWINIIYKIDNKNLLYSTGNYIQYLVTTNNVKESEKEYTHLYN